MRVFISDRELASVPCPPDRYPLEHSIYTVVCLLFDWGFGRPRWEYRHDLRGTMIEAR